MQLLNNYTVMAAAVVEHTFPPKTIDEARRITTALNLLNAVVKTEEGKSLTSYNYIKGMVACMFAWLLYHPMEGVQIYWNKEENITYICVAGLQLSFHHVPIVRYYVKLCQGEGMTPIEWDGIQRQAFAANLFRQALNGEMPAVSEEETRELLHTMVRCTVRKIIRRINQLEGVKPFIKDTPLPPPKKEKPQTPKQVKQKKVKEIEKMRTLVQRTMADKPAVNRYGDWKMKAALWQQEPEKQHLFQLALALQFNGWYEEDFALARKGDRHIYAGAKYTGSNYGHLVEKLVGNRPLRYIRPEKKLNRGWSYFIQRSTWSWKHMTYTRYLLMAAHYNYLRIDKQFYNLCITYGMARYLATAYPDLRFVNVLNFTRFTVKRKVYSAADLQRVTLQSKARRLKVWMVVDPRLLLAHLDIESLPPDLVEEYRQAPDYYKFFQKEEHKGRIGLRAYERYRLLPPIYKHIWIIGHYAHVKNHENKWAIYSLMEEKFKTDFIFDSISYDPALYLIVGSVGPEKVVIHSMQRPE